MSPHSFVVADLQPLRAARASWVKDLSDWFRGSPEAPSPFRGYVAFPLDGGTRAAIGLVGARLLVEATSDRVDAPDADESARRAIDRVLNGVRALVGSLFDRAPRWRVTVCAGAPFTGNSMSLACAVSALASLGDGFVSPRVSFTAGLAATRDELEGASSASIPGKLQSARAWGYESVVGVLPEGRLGTLDESTANQGSGTATIPLHALLMGLDQWIRWNDPSWYARVLAAHDRRSADRHDDVIRDATRVVDAPDAAPLARAVAWDIIARRRSHQGRTTDAAAADEQAKRCAGVVPLPDGPFGDYLRERAIAHRSIVVLDLGCLEDEHPAHVAVDEAVERLERLPWQRRSESLSLHFLRHTRARRWLYAGRVDSRRDLAERALRESLIGRDRWHDLLDEYAAATLGDLETSCRRAENLVIECAESCERLGSPARATIDWDGLWPRTLAPSDGCLLEDRAMSPFDVAGAIRWWSVSRRSHRDSGHMLSELVKATERCTNEPESIAYPQSLAICLALDIVAEHDPLVQPLCERLLRSTVFSAQSVGILRLVALRCAASLKRHGRSAPRIDRPPGRLGEIWDRIVESGSPDVARIPY